MAGSVKGIRRLSRAILRAGAATGAVLGLGGCAYCHMEVDGTRYVFGMARAESSLSPGDSALAAQAHQITGLGLFACDTADGAAYGIGWWRQREGGLKPSDPAIPPFRSATRNADPVPGVQTAHGLWHWRRPLGGRPRGPTAGGALSMELFGAALLKVGREWSLSLGYDRQAAFHVLDDRYVRGHPLEALESRFAQ